MSWTKRQFVMRAYEELGYATYQFDLHPEQLQAGLQRLDAMLASWNGMGIRISYPLPSSPELSNLDEETNVPDAANEAIVLNLAIRIAPTLGKLAAIETKVSAEKAFNQLMSKKAQPIPLQLPGGVPLGAGYRGTRIYSNTPDDNLLAGEDSLLEF